MAEGPKLLQDILAALKDSIAAEAHAREMGMQVCRQSACNCVSCSFYSMHMEQLTMVWQESMLTAYDVT